MLTKRSQEGYLMIDHRAGDGIGQELAQRHGAIPVLGGQLFESATCTCKHCQRVIVLNPDRTRSRGYCPKCDHYVCDECEASRVQTGICRPFSQIADEVQTLALKSSIIF